MDKKELLFDVIPAEKGDGKSAEDFCGTSPTQATASGIVKGKAPPTSPVRKWMQITAMILVALILAAIVTGLLVAFIPSGSSSGSTCSPTTAKCIGGFLFQGICLRASEAKASNSDNIPADCEPYQPAVSWTRSDFETICRQYGGGYGCSNVDTGRNSGRCSNHKAVVAFEYATQPRVWVSKSAFTWWPYVSATSSYCKMVPKLPGKLVYACKNPCRTPSAPTPLPPSRSCVSYVCAGVVYKGMCLVSNSNSWFRAGHSSTLACGSTQKWQELDRQDFLNLCSFFAPANVDCASVLFPTYSGQCVGNDVLAFENYDVNSSVWVNSYYFRYWKGEDPLPTCEHARQALSTEVYQCSPKATRVPTIGLSYSAACPPTSANCPGLVHRGVCLQSSVIGDGYSGDPPPTCIPYVPDLGWEFPDYLDICEHFTGNRTCFNVNYATSQGGRCSGQKAILSFFPAWRTNVWAHSDAFNWNPSHLQTPTCTFPIAPNGITVFACAFAKDAMPSNLLTSQ